jgi:ribose/xylose/arabinose/galactoside ABC-type transport system permease subunit
MTGNSAAPPSDERRLRIPLWRRLFGTAGIFFLLALLLGVGVLVSPDVLSADNLLRVLRSVTLLGIVAVGCAFITYSGKMVDLSIPVIMAFAGLAAVSALSYGLFASLAAGLAVGVGLGAINGWAVGYLRLNPIIWTLGVAFMLDGFMRWIYGGSQVYPDASTSAGSAFVALSRQELWAGLPLMTLFWILLALGGQWLMTRSRFGAHARLTGSAYEAAITSGVNVRRVVLYCFMISGIASAIGGILLTSLSKQGTFSTGVGYDFNAITAIVLGGVLLSGGRGSIFGVVGGVLFIGLLMNIMTLIGVDYFTQMMLRGTIFILVVGLTAWFSRSSGREGE